MNFEITLRLLRCALHDSQNRLRCAFKKHIAQVALRFSKVRKNAPLTRANYIVKLTILTLILPSQQVAVSLPGRFWSCYLYQVPSFLSYDTKTLAKNFFS